jgi:hypothetical protein
VIQIPLPLAFGFVFLAALAAGGLVGWLQQKSKHRLRATLTETIGRLRGERDAVLDGVRWVPMKNEEFKILAKQGCKTCGGLGYVKGSKVVKNDKNEVVKNDKGEELVRAFTKVCTCVVKAMAGNPMYGAVADGVPVRIATKEEVAAIKATEKGPQVRW